MLLISPHRLPPYDSDFSGSVLSPAGVNTIPTTADGASWASIRTYAVSVGIPYSTAKPPVFTDYWHTTETFPT